MKKILTLLFTATILVSSYLPSFAQETESFKIIENKFKAQITGIKHEECFEGELCSEYSLKIISENRRNDEIKISVTPEEQEIFQAKNYQVGDTVLLLSSEFDGEVTYFITDHVRSYPIYLLAGIFIFIVIIVGKGKGLSSLIGLSFSVFVLFFVVIPLILKGYNPTIVSFIGSIFIAVSSIYFSHGFKRKSTIAIIGTLTSILIVFILAHLFTNLMKLTGYGSEETIFLASIGDTELNMKGILLASLIFGGIGILDDVTISQVSVVKELMEAGKDLSPRKLYQKAMNIGHDHIASMVNTLFLAYASSALPLVLLLRQTNAPFEEIINNEQIAEEILRSIVGSIGLILAVPLTTFFAVYFLSKKPVNVHSRFTTSLNSSTIE